MYNIMPASELHIWSLYRVRPVFFAVCTLKSKTRKPFPWKNLGLFHSYFTCLVYQYDDSAYRPLGIQTLARLTSGSKCTGHALHVNIALMLW